jgi:hypothetical protein
MLGSLLYTSICTYSLPSTPTAPQDSSLALHAKLSSLVCAVSALALAVSVQSNGEQVRFWAFCAFEACVGMYYPVQGMLRGSLISNEHRATVSTHPHPSNTRHSLVVSAIFVIPRASQYIRRHITAHRCFVCTKYGLDGELAHARLFVHHDGTRCSKPCGPGPFTCGREHKTGMMDNILFRRCNIPMDY